MAENNSSAPLKTVPMIEAFEAAYSRDWNDPAGDEIKEIWHRAWHAAVAAQAAPAAVAVPASWSDIEDDRPTSRADLERVMDEWNETTGALPRDSGWRAEVLGMLHDAYDLGAHQATPALPATEDSSAGDLAEAPDVRDIEIAGLTASVGHLSSLIDQQQATLKRAKDAMSALHSAASPVNESRGNFDALIPEEDFAQFVDEHAALMCAIANSPVAPAAQEAVQAEPVAWPATCDGHEQEAWEAWAKSEHHDMSEHPLHYLFLNERTNAARQGWKAGLVYAVAQMQQRPFPAPQAQPADALTKAALDVLAERARQIGAEGWTQERDDSYSECELALAAASYACAAAGYAKGKVPPLWPWSLEWWKPTYGRRDLEKAGALILAEMERFDRAAMAAAQEGGNAAKEA